MMKANSLNVTAKGMVKWFFLFCLFTFLPLTASAQQFGYLSYEAALKAMPEYATVQQNLSALKAKYDAELKRVEDDFNKKYEEFLDGQRDFPATILQKRQSELQEMLASNMKFKSETQRLLAKAKAEMMDPLRQKLDQRLAQIGTERGLAFILNTDQNACPFINPAMGVDLNDVVTTAN